MSEPITMPALSDTMNSGRLVKWVKKPGDAIKKGETIAEVETDKAVMEVEAFHDGLLAGPVAPEGTEMPVGQVIGYIVDKRVDAADGVGQAAPTASGGAAPKRPAAPATVSATTTSVRDQSIAPTPVRAPPVAGPVRASPYARRIAQELGVDLTKAASGHADVHADLVFDAARRSSLPDLDAGPPYRIERTTSLREAVARSMIDSLATPTFRVTAQLQLAPLKKTAESAQKSLTLLLARACAFTVRAHPFFNAVYTPAGLAMRERVDVGIAVDTPDGLIAAVLRDVAQRPLSALAADWSALRDKVNSRRLTPQDYRGATFYLANLGTFPVVHRFDAVLPLGAAAILCVAAAQESSSSVTIVCDHRVVSGADGARFLQTLSELLADPSSLASDLPLREMEVVSTPQH